jgi:hypothetical protein
MTVTGIAYQAISTLYSFMKIEVNALNKSLYKKEKYEKFGNKQKEKTVRTLPENTNSLGQDEIINT